MYAYIKGTLVEVTPQKAILDVQGVGYAIFIPANLLGQLPQVGTEVQLFTSWVVREQSQTLYGFLAPQERDLFEVLIEVNGVGPKLALSLIGHLPLEELRQAVIGQDLISLSKVPGIGKKMAQRLMIELRDKLSQLFGETPAPYFVKKISGPANDAVSALMNLGYSQAKAQAAVEKTLGKESKECDLATLITHSLKNI